MLVEWCWNRSGSRIKERELSKEWRCFSEQENTFLAIPWLLILIRYYTVWQKTLLAPTPCNDFSSIPKPHGQNSPGVVESFHWGWKSSRVWSWALLGEQDRTGQGADGEAHRGCVKGDSSPASWDLIKREKQEEALWRSKVKTTSFPWPSVSHWASTFSMFSHRIPATTHAVAPSLPLFMNTASLEFLSNLLLSGVSQPPSGSLLYPWPAPTGFSFFALWGCVFILPRSPWTGTRTLSYQA